jgi:hypothetical protein
MPDVDSPATGRRDTDEIEMTPAMIVAGTRELARWSVADDLPENVVAAIFAEMISARPPESLP